LKENERRVGEMQGGKRGNRDPIAGEKAERLQQDVPIHPFLIHLSSIPSSLHPFLLPPQPSTLQRAALMSNITHATVAARALIISERDRVRKSDDTVSQQSRERRRNGGRRKGEDKGAFVIFPLTHKMK